MDGILALSAMYMDSLDTHPLLTKSVTASMITAASNFVSQFVTFRRKASESKTRATSDGTSKERQKHYNKRDIVKYLLFGLLWVGPSSHFWQNALERLVPRRRGETKASWALRKMLCDQICYGPVGNAVFLGFIGRVIQGLSFGGTVRKVQREFVGTQVSGWCVWPFASVVNQYFVPIELRVGFLNFVAFFWSLYLMTTKGGKGKRAKKDVKNV